MLAAVESMALLGLDGRPVRVEVDIQSGLPGFHIVGLPDQSVKEAQDRVRSAIKNSGFQFPLQRVTVNLAPGDLKKEGPLFDLPIALGVLAASEQLPLGGLAGKCFLGELSLDGRLRGVPGVLPMALAASGRGRALALPEENAPEAALVEGLTIYGLSSLADAAALVRGEKEDVWPPVAGQALLAGRQAAAGPDMAEVRGQAGARRALEIAAAGGHNVLLIGPPGSGKTMLARRFPGILPALTWEECLEASALHSVAGLLTPERPLLTERPFRAPHHTASAAALIGGGRIPRPGEVSLATHGVLFLDELPEFERPALEALRQPLEDGTVQVARVAASLRFPARFQLVAAMNPCPCGYLGDPVRQCTCTPPAVARYRQKISGPLLDRIDLHVEVPRMEYAEVEGTGEGESSAAIRERVERARELQRQRQAGGGEWLNARLSARQVREFCRLQADARRLLRQAFNRLGLSLRAHDRLLKVARTIADLAGAQEISAAHLAEALQYRCLDRERV